MRTAVYSGSFNPLHIGHLGILKGLCADGRFDRVLLVVSPQNPLKDEIGTGGRERFEAAREAVARRGLNVTVDDIELGMEPPHYTIRTLEALRRRSPEEEFTLVVGADNLAQMRRWRDYGRILSEFGIAVYPRSGFDREALAKDLRSEEGGGRYRIEMLEMPVIDISSSEIRRMAAEGLDVSRWLM